jgi:hypothetical protein
MPLGSPSKRQATSKNGAHNGHAVNGAKFGKHLPSLDLPDEHVDLFHLKSSLYFTYSLQGHLAGSGAWEPALNCPRGIRYRANSVVVRGDQIGKSLSLSTVHQHNPSKS